MPTLNQFQKLLKTLLERDDIPPRERLRTRALGGGPAPVVRFDFGDKGIFTLDLTESGSEQLKAGSEGSANPNLEVRVEWETFRGIWTRQIDPVEALRNGDLELRGSMRLAHGLQRYFVTG